MPEGVSVIFIETARPQGWAEIDNHLNEGKT